MTRPISSDIGSGYADLGERTETEGLFFWPVADSVVYQPGSKISLSLELEEWLAETDATSGFFYGPAINETHTETYDLPTDGREYHVADLHYNYRGFFTDGALLYDAYGRIYAQWVGGSNPGIYLRVETNPIGSSLPLAGQIWQFYGAVLRLNGTGTTFVEDSGETVARFGYSQTDSGNWENGVPLPGLARSQDLYEKREKTVSAGIYAVTADVALQMAQSIVEVSYQPTRVYRLEVVPRNDPLGGDGGYRARPHHIGRRAILPDGSGGELRRWDYSENHVGASASAVTIEVHVPAADQIARVGTRANVWNRAAYGSGKYLEAVIPVVVSSVDWSATEVTWGGDPVTWTV
jgi:hypothetical protein